MLVSAVVFTSGASDKMRGGSIAVMLLPSPTKPIHLARDYPLDRLMHQGSVNVALADQTLGDLNHRTRCQKRTSASGEKPMSKSREEVQGQPVRLAQHRL